MKKFGFTLAELLVTISIIGVIAALVVPQFVGNTKSQSNASKLSTIVSDYENVFGLMLLQENVESMSDTAFAKATTNAARETALEQYTKVTLIKSKPSDLGYVSFNSVTPFCAPAFAKDSTSGGGGEQSLIKLNVNQIKSGTESIEISYGISIPSGAVLFMALKPSGATDDVWQVVYIDVNGPSAPNTLGRDVFAFVLGQDGHLYPYGSAETKDLLGITSNGTWRDTDTTYGCTGSTAYKGYGCTARLIEHNYKVDY